MSGPWTSAPQLLAWKGGDDGFGAAWPFAALAGDAVRPPPDLIIHVGDYSYRGTPDTLVLPPPPRASRGISPRHFTVVGLRDFGFMELAPGAKGAWTGTLASPAGRVLARSDSARPRREGGQSICTLQ